MEPFFDHALSHVFLESTELTRLFFAEFLEQVRLLLGRDLLLHLLSQLDVIVRDRAADEGGLEVGLVDALLAVLEVETEIVLLELGIMVLLDALHVLDLAQSAERTGAEELVLRVVIKVHTAQSAWRRVDDADCEQSAIDPMLHVVAASVRRPDALVLPLTPFVMFEVSVNVLRGERLVLVEQWHLAEEPLVRIACHLLFFVFVHMQLIFLVDLMRFLSVHSTCDLHRVLVFRLAFVQRHRAVLNEILAVGWCLDDLFLDVLLFNFLHGSPIDDSEIAGLFYLHLNTTLLHQVAIDALEELILVLVWLDLEEGHDGQIRAPALRLLKSLVAARDHIDAFDLAINQEIQLLFEKLLEMLDQIFHNVQPRVYYLILHFLLLLLFDFLEVTALTLEEEVVELAHDFSLALANLKVEHIHSNRIGLAAAFHEVVLIDVCTAAAPPAIHHRLIVYGGQLRSAEAPGRAAGVLLLALAVAAVGPVLRVVVHICNVNECLARFLQNLGFGQIFFL